MFAIIDSIDESRPRVKALIVSKDEAIDAFLALLNDGSLYKATEPDKSQYLQANKLINSKGYVSGGSYAIQRL